MHRKEILEAAIGLTTGDRLKSYGEPYKNHEDIAVGWSVILGTKVLPHEVALCMAWLKIARTRKDPHLADSYVDGAAYMAIAGQIVEGPSEVSKSIAKIVSIEAGMLDTACSANYLADDADSGWEYGNRK